MLQGVFSLEGSYAVYLEDKAAGKLQIEKEGLYYRLTCRCVVPDDLVYRLFAVTDQGRENLGVVLPENGGYVLQRKIPAKRLQPGCRFLLSARGEENTGKFVPVYPEEPFTYITQLETAFLEVRNGQTGLRWKENPGAG